MLTNYTKRVIEGGMEPPKTPAELIERLTPAVLTEHLGVSDAAISNAKGRNAMPPRWWPTVVVVAKNTPGLEGFTFEDLIQLHTARPARRHAEQPRPKPRAAAVAR